MAKADVRTNNSRWVHTTGTSVSDMPLQEGKPTFANMDSKSATLVSVGYPSPEQERTFLRGMARGALLLPKDERKTVLREVLEAMGMTKGRLER